MLFNEGSDSSSSGSLLDINGKATGDKGKFDLFEGSFLYFVIGLTD